MQARAARHNGAVSFVMRSANLGDVVGIVDVYPDSWRDGYGGLLEQEVRPLRRASPHRPGLTSKDGSCGPRY